MNIMLMLIKYKHRPTGMLIIMFHWMSSYTWDFTNMHIIEFHTFFLNALDINNKISFIF